MIPLLIHLRSQKRNLRKVSGVNLNLYKYTRGTNRNKIRRLLFFSLLLLVGFPPHLSQHKIPSFPRFLLSPFSRLPPLSLSLTKTLVFLHSSPIAVSLLAVGIFPSDSALLRSMSGGVRSSPGLSQPPPPPQHPSSSPAPVASVPVVPPIRRHLAFASTKPPFHPSDDYHRFTPYSLSNNDRSLANGCGVVDREEDAVVVRSPVSLPRF